MKGVFSPWTPLCWMSIITGQIPPEELRQEKKRLARKVAEPGKPRQIDAKEALAYRRRLRRLMAHGTPAERKKLVRACVSEMKLAPQDLEVEMTYKVPEPVMHNVVAGARYTAEKKTLARILDFEFERERFAAYLDGFADEEA